MVLGEVSLNKATLTMSHVIHLTAISVLSRTVAFTFLSWMWCSLEMYSFLCDCVLNGI